MLVREMQHDASADRAAHDHRLVEFERVGDVDDHAHVVARGELYSRVLPAGGRRGLAVPGHVEGDDAEIVGDALVVHQPAILAAVGAGGVQAEQRNALAGLLDIKPVRLAEQIEMQIAAGNRFEARAHRGPLSASLRGAAITSLK